MNSRWSRHAFAALVSALVLGAGCGIDDALVGGRCSSGYVRCGDRCCPNLDGSLADATSLDGQVPDGDDGGDDGDANGIVGGGCPLPLTSCAGTCVNLRWDSRNCGACGGVCPPNELCVSGTCGQLTGGIVYIGSDFDGDLTASQRQVLLNAVDLASGSPASVLSYEEYAWPSVVTRLSAILSAPEYLVTHTTSPKAVTNPDFTVQDFGVFLVCDQALAPPGYLSGLGATWASALKTYVSNGGIVIVLDGGTSTTGAGSGTGEMPAFAASTGLLDVTAHSYLAPGTSIDLGDKNDAVGVRLLHPFDIARNAVSLTTEPASSNVSYVLTVLTDSGPGAPVVVHKTF